MNAVAIRARDPRPRSVRRIVAGTLAVAAGAVHLALVPEHLQEGIWLGMLFLADGLALAATGIWVTATGSPLARASASTALLLTVLAYLASRTLGLPGFGHEAWDSLGIGTTAAELAAVCALAATQPVGGGPRSGRGPAGVLNLPHRRSHP